MIVKPAIQADIKDSNRPYAPRGAALDLFYCKAHEILIEGPAGTGKSRAVLEKLHLCAKKYPGMRALLVRKTRASCTQSILVTFEEKVVEARSSILGGASRMTRQSYRYQNGSEVVVGGLDNADRIMSSEYDIIAVFEATECTEDDWEKLKSRLRNGKMPYQQIIADCNPQAPTHWLNVRFADCTSTSMARRRMLSRHEDNPACTAAYVETLSALTGVRRDRLYLGRWVAAEGVVYPEFDRSVHVIDRFDVPSDWRRIRSIDFGFTNPAVVQWWAIDGDGRMYLYREIYHTGLIVSDPKGTVDDLSKQVLRLSGKELIEYTVSDHDAEDRETLHRAGVWTKAATKDISPGLQAVSARLKKAGDGKPRLYLMRDALVTTDTTLRAAGRPTCTADEFDVYVWPDTRDGASAKEQPTKDNDHGMDAMRYAVMSLDSGGLGLSLRVLSARRTNELA